jgi:hypothetical protein
MYDLSKQSNSDLRYIIRYTEQRQEAWLQLMKQKGRDRGCAVLAWVKVKECLLTFKDQEKQLMSMSMTSCSKKS